MAAPFDHSEESTETRLKVVLPIPPVPGHRPVPPPAPAHVSHATHSSHTSLAMPSYSHTHHDAHAHQSSGEITCLNGSSRIIGKLFFEGQVRIDGHVEGEILAKDSVTIGRSGTILAQIRADAVVIEGRVDGDVIALTRIELRDGAKVMGNLSAPAVIMHEGAMFEGHCSMKPEPTWETAGTPATAAQQPGSTDKGSGSAA